MFAEIITIGDEILIGQIIDTNSAFIAQELNKIGVSVYQISSVQDDRAHILKALREAESRSDIVIVTGGLGPTKDDITKHTLCEYFGDTLVENHEVLLHVEEIFKKYISSPISELNRQQAWVLSRAEVLHNEYGTAPGMWIQRNGKVVVSLPGVPFEMKHLITTKVVPRIIEGFKRPFIVHKTMITYGMGESAIAEILEPVEVRLPSEVKLAYLPSLGSVRLRLTGKGPDKDQLNALVQSEANKIKALLGNLIYGEDGGEPIEELVANLLIQKNMTLGTAESFTGGRIAQKITSIPGASAYFKGSVVSYATQTKIEVLKVPQALIEQYSVVSAQVAEAMASNLRALLKTDFAIATTGNAGPTKGDADVEVGTVYIAIASPKRVIVEKYLMGSQRDRVVQKSVNKAFELLQKEILKL
ncbi:Nicotinamide-nucleotide amidohydrolase PncC [Arenibacter antarcticus]|uniref:CinA-like protein n=1 Tax=Arenibacter antarcticus TaxID=2040469 RepID=A0ABW5VNL1_9FLAO|nr:competence/damage-inducible protein A [Arenibacter sp. H213]MCM4168664.1 competence/damage-inducible protein A [Arenibacter sp. H213]